MLKIIITDLFLWNTICFRLTSNSTRSYVKPMKNWLIEITYFIRQYLIFTWKFTYRSILKIQKAFEIKKRIYYESILLVLWSINRCRKKCTRTWVSSVLVNNKVDSCWSFIMSAFSCMPNTPGWVIRGRDFV